MLGITGGLLVGLVGALAIIPVQDFELLPLETVMCPADSGR